MKYNLFLDDIREPEEAYSYTQLSIYTELNWKIVRNYEEFINYIKRNHKKYSIMPEIISFDHDLADEHYRPSMITDPEKYSGYYDNGTFKEKTGMECAKWLVNFCMDNGVKMPKCYVHSMNPVGSKNIINYINNYISVIENH